MSRVISGLRLEVEVRPSALLGYYAAYSGNCIPKFRETLSVHLGFLDLEDGAYRLFRNVDKELPLYAA
jgi:hypothetical protein